MSIGGNLSLVFIGQEFFTVAIASKYKLMARKCEKVLLAVHEVRDVCFLVLLLVGQRN